MLRWTLLSTTDTVSYHVGKPFDTQRGCVVQVQTVERQSFPALVQIVKADPSDSKIAALHDFSRMFSITDFAFTHFSISFPHNAVSSMYRKLQLNQHTLHTEIISPSLIITACS